MNASSTPWMAPTLPPDRLEPLEVRLHDNTVLRGVWTGAKWWADGREIQPQAWRTLRPELWQRAS